MGIPLTLLGFVVGGVEEGMCTWQLWQLFPTANSPTESLFSTAIGRASTAGTEEISHLLIQQFNVMQSHFEGLLPS